MKQNRKGINLSDRVYRLERRTFLKVCEAVNTPRSLACYLLAKHEEWEQYLSLSFPDVWASSFPDDYLCTEMMRKNPRLPVEIDRKAVALAKFQDAELACLATNSRLRDFQKGSLSVDPEIIRVLHVAHEVIRSILGPLTRRKLDFAEHEMRFGPGATSALSGHEVLPSRKMTCSMHVTPRLYPYWRALLPETWRSEVTDVTLRAYSTVTTVPKDAKTDRLIAIEPHLNIYAQLGAGALIRRQLRFAGLDLNSQEHNRKAAARAMLDGLATIDLSSASDTVSRELVWMLLPEDWVQFLDTLRCESSVVESQEVILEKFSSMGNGFTFELESLIFYSLALACSPTHALAYGDDIIVTQSDAPLLLRTLEFLGFSVNSKKTFMAGVFFESCGTDWWNGQDVRPFYFKGEPNDYHSSVIRMANAIRRYAHRRSGDHGCDRRFLSAWISLVTESPIARRTSIPDGFGDDGLVRNFDESAPPRLKHGWQGYRGRIYLCRPVRSKLTDILGAYLLALRWGSGDISRGIEYTRGRISRGQLTSIPCFTWDDLGPWI